ncbi:MAG: hypothetical protein ACTHNW_00315 [Mucilaginibacter sp.]
MKGIPGILSFALLTFGCKSHNATNANDSVGGTTKADSAMMKTQPTTQDSNMRMSDTAGPGTGKASPAPGTGGPMTDTAGKKR